LLRVVRLPVEADGFIWSLNAITGSLLKSPKHLLTPSVKNQIPPRVESALRYCYNPYDLIAPKTLAPERSITAEHLRRLQCFKTNLQILEGKWLFFSLIYAGFPDLIFDSTEKALVHISELYSHSIGSDCLQKTLLAAKTSKSFANSGVVFIGANLPTGHMHSWIIEDGYQPDVLDRHWISYQPILAIYAS
jgi:hypothetical protein